MFCLFQDGGELEDELYRDDDGDSEKSEVDSEVEFHLYSQLHYSSNAGELGEEVEEEEEGSGQKEENQESGKAPSAEEVKPVDGVVLPSPNTSGIQPHVKKQNKPEKQKKRKSELEGQGSCSSPFEEVIVIDSSPDVISLSDDDTADDEGVCSLKGGIEQRRLQTSTPAQQRGQKQERNFSVPVIVDSSSSESESESESQSSDSSDSGNSFESEVLENWMILGKEKRNEDLSISLNLEGGYDSDTDCEEVSSWLVSNKDKEAQIYNKDKGARTVLQRIPSRYYTNKNVLCRNCNKTGHLSKNCPEPTRLSPCYLCGTPGHVSSDCPNRHCNNCGLPGHLFDCCSERPYWHKQCHRCGMKGHFFDACPEIWRQYHITTKTGSPAKLEGQDNGRSPAYCYNCSRRGHFGHSCTQKRMFNGVFASIPFINHYDTLEDVKHRQHRLKLKVKELKKNGCFPDTLETPVTPGPAKKKQKLSHHRGDQTPNNHKPSSSHIFFKDSDDRTTKTNKFNKCKQQQSSGNAKPWKPKRPVPTSRDPLPPARLILDEADDYPRGGAKEQWKEKKKFKMKKKKKTQGFSKGGHEGSRQNHLFAKQGSGSQQEAAENRKRRRSRNKRNAAQMYPTDENLFIIKQRRRSR